MVAQPVTVASQLAPLRAPADDDLLPVLPALQPLLPGLRRGQSVVVDELGSLAVALLAGPSLAGSWCAVVGLPDFGVLAAADMGCSLDRLLLVDDPRDRWSDVVATLLEVTDVVLVRPGSQRLPSGIVRRLSAIARKSGSCLIVAGQWEGATVRLRVESSLWTGIGSESEQGHGYLRGRRVKVQAVSRGRPQSAWLWLPGPDGSVAPAQLSAVS